MTLEQQQQLELDDLNRDARRIETRANELIDYADLADDYGETGGLIAAYDLDTRVFTIQDEAVKATWTADERGRLTWQQWHEMECFIYSCTDVGCIEEHEHFQEEGR